MSAQLLVDLDAKPLEIYVACYAESELTWLLMASFDAHQDLDVLRPATREEHSKNSDGWRVHTCHVLGDTPDAVDG
jgi:hypothetical protein